MRRTAMSATVVAGMVLAAGCTGADSRPSGSAGGAAVDTAPARPQACTAEIVNTWFERPRYTGPGDSFDPDATRRAVAELLSPDCAVEPDECVRQVLDTVNSVGQRPRAAAVRTYTSSPACTRLG